MLQYLGGPLIAILLSLLRGSKPTGKFKAVSDFDAERFFGTWFIAAHIPQPLQKKLGSLTIEYRYGDDGTIEMTNRGYDKKKEEWKSEEYVARFKESENTGWLKVDTANPLDKSHKIIYLDDDYSLAIVVGLTMKSLLVMYRDPDLAKRDLDVLIGRAGELGFKISKLTRDDQSHTWQSDQRANATVEPN